MINTPTGKAYTLRYANEHMACIYRPKPTTAPSSILIGTMDRPSFRGRHNIAGAICIKLGRRGLNTYGFFSRDVNRIFVVSSSRYTIRDARPRSAVYLFILLTRVYYTPLVLSLGYTLL